MYSFYNPELKTVISQEMRDSMLSHLSCVHVGDPNGYYVADRSDGVLSASSLGTHIDANGTPIEKWFDDAVNIERYCLDRLAEILRLNVLSHTPSAFSCIFSFMSFLSQFASKDDNETEAHCFRNLTVKYMRQLRCCCKDNGDKKEVRARVWESGKKLGDEVDFNTWGEVLYSMCRCGLVHSLSTIGNRNLDQNQINLKLTHAVLTDAATVDLYESGENDTEKSKLIISNSTESKEIIINAFDLCDAVRKSILKLFQDSDAVARAKDVMKNRPAIMAVAK